MASRKIYIDASVFYAFTDRADPNHQQAVKTMETLALQGVSLYTSPQTMHDAYTAINNQLGSALGFDFLQSLFESSVEILCPQKADLISAFRLLRTNREKRIGFKEALRAVLMQKKGISLIFTFTFWHNLLGTESYSRHFG